MKTRIKLAWRVLLGRPVVANTTFTAPLYVRPAKGLTIYNNTVDGTGNSSTGW